MKRPLFALITIALTGAGCISTGSPTIQTLNPSSSTQVATVPDVVIPSDAKTELWIISSVFTSQIVYAPIEWFTGDQAITESKKDGCEDDQGCVPNGFYWRYKNNEKTDKVWPVDNASSIRVKLICNSDHCTPDDPAKDGFTSMSYTSYVSADQVCRTSPTECPYYTIGTGMDFFEVTLSSDDSILQLSEWYVP